MGIDNASTDSLNSTFQLQAHSVSSGVFMPRKVGLLKLHQTLEVPCLITVPAKRCWLVSKDQLGGLEVETTLSRVVTYSLCLTPSERYRPCSIIPLEQETDLAVLKACFEMGHEQVCIAATEPYLGRLSSADAIKTLYPMLDDPFFSQVIRKGLIDYGLRGLFYEPGAQALWSIMGEDVWLLIEKGIESGKSLETLLELRRNAEHPRNTSYSFWSARAEGATVGSQEFQLLPDNFQVRILEDTHQKLEALGQRAALSDPAIDAFSIYNEMDQQDRQLAAAWAGDTSNCTPEIRAGIMGQMLSARGAEIAVAQFYRNLGYSVEDISITQLSNGTDWLTHDLRLDNSIFIDVKNSRTPQNSSRTYTEHIIPKFKHSRGGKEIIIVGVMSPYAKYDSITGEMDISGHTNGSIIVLGETTGSSINKLSERFGRTLDLELVQDNSAFGDTHRSGRVIPQWLFDFPARYYSERSELLKEVSILSDVCLLTAQQLKLINRRPSFGLLLASRRRLPENWRPMLARWQWDFYHQLLNEPLLNLPVLFLSILEHFIHSLRHTPPHYSPDKYMEIIADGTQSIAVKDPTQSLRALCANLSKVWRQRDAIELSKFKQFQFKGLGILRALHPNGKWLTLIAYCGGETDKRAKCGYPDLVIGEHKPCGKCGRLICPRCDYCFYNCPRYVESRNRRRLAEYTGNYHRMGTQNSTVIVRDDSEFPLY